MRLIFQQVHWNKRIDSLSQKILALHLVLILAVVLTGCGRKSESTPLVQSTTVAETGEPTSVAPTDPKQPGGSARVKETAIDLSSLTRTLRKFSAENRRVPSNFDELITSGYIRKESLPAIPAGKKFGINSKRVEVILVNQ